MTIYKKTNYRKIYEQQYGTIPKDKLNRSYEIHHIDGNRNNNDISNLACVSLQDHYNIHYSQGDWIACHRIGLKLKLSGDEISELARKHAKMQLATGIHPWQRRADGTSHATDKVNAGTHHWLDRDAAISRNNKRVAEGTHPFMKRADGTSVSSDRVESGKHNFLGGAIQRAMNKRTLEAGTHPSQKEWTCEYCGKVGKGASNYTKNHGNNCKAKTR